MVNPTYKHLDAKMRLGGLRLSQWLQLIVAGGCAVVFGIYLSPLPAGPTITLSLFVAGLPVAVSFAAQGLEFSVSSFLRALWRFGRSPRRYLPGGGQTAAGYVVVAEEREPAFEPGIDATPSSRIAELWD
jgi:hypothetical protein